MDIFNEATMNGDPISDLNNKSDGINRLMLDMAGATCISLSRDYNDEIITCDVNSNIVRVFDSLALNNISFMPLTSSDGAYQGYVDFQCLLRHTLDVVEFLDDQIDKNNESYIQAKKEWRTTPISTIMMKKGQSIHEGQSLLAALEIMHFEKVHGLPILDCQSSVIGVFTQSMFISWLHSRSALYPQLELTNISVIRPYNIVESISDSSSMIEALVKMDVLGLSSLAILDPDGELCDVITTHDLRGITTDSHTLRWLYNNVVHFKTQVRNSDLWAPESIVTVYSSDRFKDLLTSLEDNSVKRVFVLDNSKQLVDSLSMSDIIAFILQQEREIRI